MSTTALVTITVKRILDIDPTTLAGAQRAYALARIGGRAFGRSRTIPSAKHEFDLSSEPTAWQNQVSADGGDIPVVVEIWDDRGDDAPQQLAKIAGMVPVPYLSLEMTIGGKPGAVLQVETNRVPAAASTAAVPRVAPGMKTRATLRPVNSVVVAFTDIQGLYAPAALGSPGIKRSERTPGYLSEDHLGRVFLNRDVTKKWKSNTQQIELEVGVTAVRGTIPAKAEVKWRVLDVDDLSNDDPGIHRQWGSYLDPNDYDTSGNPKGAAGADNEGSPSHAPWHEVAGFALSGAAKDHAFTAIVAGRSKVLLDCPSTAGDNFIVAVEVRAKNAESFGARTGVITMWHHLEVESIRMKSGLALPTDEIPIPFEAACVELEFAAEREVDDRPFLAPNHDTLSTQCSAYVDSVFTHKSDPGWFCIIAAMEPHPLPKLKGDKAFEGKVTLQVGGSGSNRFEYFEIPGAIPDADFAELSTGADSVSFSIFSAEVVTTAAGTVTRCWLQEHDAQPEFTAGDGSISHAQAIRYLYSPRFRKHAGAITSGGYGMPNQLDATVFKPGAFYTAGISPPVRRGKESYFAGRTIVFTHHGAYRDPITGGPRPKFREKALQVMVHELVHAFGMPHKCGYFDFRTPRQKTCCMNYGPNWMVDDKRVLIPKTSNKVGMDMCGRHLKEIRRVRLPDNKGLAWK